MDVNRIVGRHIEIARRERGWNQVRLAERLSISQNALSRWESGAVSVTADNLWRLCEIFDKKIEYFFVPLPLEENKHPFAGRQRSPAKTSAR